MEIVNDWFGLFAEPDDFTRGRHDARARWALSRMHFRVGNVRSTGVELVLPLEDADGESTANKSKK